MEYDKVPIEFKGVYRYKYSIDTLGVIRNESRGIELKGSIVKGYKRLHLGGYYLWHRLVANTFIKNPDNLPHINHIDGDKLNNSADNLEWVTAKDNIRHAFDTGLSCNKGECHPTHKLSEDLVREIKTMKGLFSARSVVDLLELPVGIQAVYDIWSGRRWSHI